MISYRLALVSGLLLCFILLIAVAVAALWREVSRRDLDKRIQEALRGGEAATNSLSSAPLSVLSALLRKLGDGIRRGTKLYSEQDLATLEGVIEAGGFNPKRVLPMLLGCKVILSILFPVAVFAYSLIVELPLMGRMVAIGLAVPVGLLVPDWFLVFPQRKYRAALRRGVSDALDLLVVCTEAGMGLESGLEEVSKEMRYSNRTLAVALSRLLDDLKVLPDRQAALTNFGNRSGVEGIRRMATILVQTLQYGTPMSHALRTIAGELRRERMIRLEERAVRLPALLVFPLVVFILPSVFIVMGGVSFLRMVDIFAAMSR